MTYGTRRYFLNQALATLGIGAAVPSLISQETRQELERLHAIDYGDLTQVRSVMPKYSSIDNLIAQSDFYSNALILKKGTGQVLSDSKAFAMKGINSKVCPAPQEPVGTMEHFLGRFDSFDVVEAYEYNENGQVNETPSLVFFRSKQGNGKSYSIIELKGIGSRNKSYASCSESWDYKTFRRMMDDIHFARIDEKLKRAAPRRARPDVV